MKASSSDTFYARLPPMRSATGVFDDRFYATAPGDWWLAFSDIKGSTAAVAAGRHTEVNFAAAAMIAALVNLCGSIPYQFGGDGAVALVPPERVAEARVALARTRGFAAREFGLELRVGLVALSVLIERGARLLVGRYEPSPGGAYAVFRGGAIELLERAIKGTGDAALAQRATIGEGEDDGEPPDLTGLSCRWTPVKAANGRMVSLVLRGDDHATLHAEIARVAGVQSLKAVAPGALEARWPPPGLMREAKARHGKWPLSLMAVLVGLETLLAWVVLRWRLNIGKFNARRYVGEVEQGAVDFARADDSLCLVFDCPGDRVDAVRAWLDARAREGRLRFGMHVSDHAVMTCLVSSPVGGQHVHFVDGGDGGYTTASIAMKASAAL